MKTAFDILSHIVSLNQFHKIAMQLNVARFIHHLPLSLKRGVAFSYVRENVLFFALKHPSFKQEFNYKLPLIKSALNTFQKQENRLLEITEIRTFISDKIPQKKEVETHIQTKAELAKGEFINLAKDEDIFNRFEKIRKEILCNKNL